MRVCEICNITSNDIQVSYYKVYNKTLCPAHYSQFKRHGKILTRTKYDKNEIILHNEYAEILLYNSKAEEIDRTKIDLEDVDKIKNYKWSKSKRGAIVSKKNGKSFKLHRLLLDVIDSKIYVDHRDHDILNNRKQNLRLCTNQQNQFNRKNAKGITFDKKNNKYRAQIMVNYKQINLGRFYSEEEAFQARKEAEIQYFGEFRNKFKNIGDK